MQRKGKSWLIWTVLPLTLLFWVGASPASVVFMGNDVIMNMEITVHPEDQSGSFKLDPVAGYMMTDLYYGAQFPLEIINKGDTQDDPPPKTSSVDISGEGNWLITQRT